MELYFAPNSARQVLDRHGDAMMEALQVEPNLIDPDLYAGQG